MTDFAHISTVVLRFLEWALPQVEERRRRGDGVTGPGRLGAPVGWAEAPGGLGAAPAGSAPAGSAPAGSGAGVSVAAEDAVAGPADAISAGVGQAGAHRLMAAAQNRVRRRLVALAGAPLGRVPDGAAAPPGPAMAWSLGSAGAPGADTAPPLSQSAPDRAMPPTVRLPGAPSPSHAVRPAEPNSDARVAQLQAFITPEARYRGATPALAAAPVTAWALGSAGVPVAPGPPEPGPQAEPNSDARVAERQALAPQFSLHPPSTDSHFMTAPAAHTPGLPAQSRLLAEAQLRQMLADIIRADALRHGLNLKER